LLESRELFLVGDQEQQTSQAGFRTDEEIRALNRKDPGLGSWNLDKEAGLEDAIVKIQR
jgi:hypothetical protein